MTGKIARRRCNIQPASRSCGTAEPERESVRMHTMMYVYIPSGRQNQKKTTTKAKQPSADSRYQSRNQTMMTLICKIRKTKRNPESGKLPGFFFDYFSIILFSPSRHLPERPRCRQVPRTARPRSRRWQEYIYPVCCNAPFSILQGGWRHTVQNTFHRTE